MNEQQKSISFDKLISKQLILNNINEDIKKPSLLRQKIDKIIKTTSPFLILAFLGLSIFTIDNYLKFEHGIVKDSIYMENLDFNVTRLDNYTFNQPYFDFKTQLDLFVNSNNGYKADSLMILLLSGKISTLSFSSNSLDSVVAKNKYNEDFNTKSILQDSENPFFNEINKNLQTDLNKLLVKFNETSKIEKKYTESTTVNFVLKDVLKTSDKYIYGKNLKSLFKADISTRYATEVRLLHSLIGSSHMEILNPSELQELWKKDFAEKTGINELPEDVLSYSKPTEEQIKNFLEKKEKELKITFNKNIIDSIKYMN